MKLIVLGNSNVGKTTLIHRYMKDEFTQNQFQTICVDFVFRDYICPLTKNMYCVYIWDTAGQERFHTLVSQFYRGSDGAIICFDITNRESFEAIPKWINEIRVYSPEVQIILCGTKSDLIDRNNMPIKRKITIDEAIYTASSYNCSYIETSSRDGNNINNLFDIIINHVIDFGAVNSIDNYDDNICNKSSFRETNRKQKEFHKKIMPKTSKSNIILATSTNEYINSNLLDIPDTSDRSDNLIDGNVSNITNITYSQSIRNKLSNITSNITSNIYCNIL